MKVSQVSPVTGQYNSMDLPITLKQLAEFRGGQPLQKVMPDLTDDEREFLISGCTPEDWKTILQEDCNVKIMCRAVCYHEKG